MTKSRENLVYRALSKLKVIAAGQTPSAEDNQVVDDMVEPTLSELAARSIYAYGDPDQIEDECFEHLAAILAQVCAEDFGLDGDDRKRVMAENRLREIGAEKLSGQPLKVDYY
jgi:hypothetical protein